MQGSIEQQGLSKKAFQLAEKGDRTGPKKC